MFRESKINDTAQYLLINKFIHYLYDKLQLIFLLRSYNKIITYLSFSSDSFTLTKTQNKGQPVTNPATREK